MICGLDRKKGKGKPLYLQISNQMRSHIESGKIRPGGRLPAISDLVSQCGVDYKTVNQALQDLEQEGLIRLDQGRGKGAIVTKNSSRKCSLMFVKWGDDVLSLEISEGIQHFAAQRGLEYTIVDGARSHERFIDALVHPIRSVDGIIVMPYEHPEYRQAILDCMKLGKKIVFVDRVLDEIPVSSVSIDHTSGAFKVTRHLLAAQGLPVYYIGFTKNPSSARDRLIGWSLAMEKYGHTKLEPYICGFSRPEHELVISDLLGLETVYDTVLKFFESKKEKKYSIFAVNDWVAKGVYMVAESLGLRIGVDVFIAGFGNTPLCEQFEVPLTSVSQSNELVGYEAASLLHMSLLGEIQKPVRRILPTTLYVRASSTGKILERQDNSNRQLSLC
jgi:LacI family transcriptional regulator